MQVMHSFVHSMTPSCTERHIGLFRGCMIMRERVVFAAGDDGEEERNHRLDPDDDMRYLSKVR